MSTSAPSSQDLAAAEALTAVIGNSRWEAVTLAHGYLGLLGGTSDEEIARAIYNRGPHTLKRSRELVEALRIEGLLSLLPPRERTGSAENPITKLFPATITEQRFLELLEELCAARLNLTYSDDRESGHGFRDFTIHEGELELPINIKNAGTRFMRAKELVGLDPDDCIPIPAYKAHGALEANPNLLYLVSVDYDLVSSLDRLLPTLLTSEEALVWDLLNDHKGSLLRDAEDRFIFATVRKYWEELKSVARNTPFNVISARRAIRILRVKPKRTPGIGLPAWGTSARGEVNVHISIQQETTPWREVGEHISSGGVASIVSAVNRKRTEEVYDPAI
jgi:hypothetical protein